MRTRELTAGVLVLLLAMIQMNAGPLLGASPTGACAAPEYGPRRVPERVKPLVIPEPASTLVREDKALFTAYYDTMRILGSGNQCSAFFGGSEASVSVFGNFMASVKRAYLPAGIGVKMSGDYINVLNARTQLKYRLFEKASVNTAGPFYQSKSANSTPLIFGVGSFPPTSREARVLMLLHELGHLMKGSDGTWLLADDGSSVEDSINNTRKIESICGDQIRELSKPVVDVELARQGSSEQTVSPAAATSSH
jgi:hypothetical protein